jgi:hypothetical protein
MRKGIAMDANHILGKRNAICATRSIMSPKLGLKAKEKLPNRCFITIWKFLGVVPPGNEFYF